MSLVMSSLFSKSEIFKYSGGVGVLVAPLLCTAIKKVHVIHFFLIFLFYSLSICAGRTSRGWTS